MGAYNIDNSLMFDDADKTLGVIRLRTRGDGKIYTIPLANLSEAEAETVHEIIRDLVWGIVDYERLALYADVKIEGYITRGSAD